MWCKGTSSRLGELGFQAPCPPLYNTTQAQIGESPHRIMERLQEHESGRKHSWARLAEPLGEAPSFAISHTPPIVYLPTSALTWFITHEFWLSGNRTLAPRCYSCTNTRTISPSFNASVVRGVCLQRRPRALPRRRGGADEPRQSARKCVTKVFFLEAVQRAALGGHTS